MDTPWECRIMDFDEKYRDIYGCYPDEEVYEDDEGNPLDKDEIDEIDRERTRVVRRALGWRT